MNKVINNKKGFTLIELLAVIVILAILVMVAIPAVTKYLNQARQSTFVDNAKSAISAVRNDVVLYGFTHENYNKTQINELLEKKLKTSPFGGDYSDGLYIQVTNNSDGTFTYSMCLTDKGKHGFNSLVKEDEINDAAVKLSVASECVAPTS